MQKFKLLATQCAVVGSPTRSPTTSPVIHIRRRKTLRMLLARGGGGGNAGVFHRRYSQQPSPDHRRNNSGHDNTGKDKNLIGVRLKLKDLFVSSPPPAPIREMEPVHQLLPESVGSNKTFPAARGGSIRPLSATLRQRLLMRRAWRPMLMAIPEQSP